MADRNLWGNVNHDGTVYTGTDYSVGLVAPGTYVVKYHTPFPETPAVTITQLYKDWNDFSYAGGSTFDNAVLVASDAAHFKVITGDSNGVKTDRNFCFNVQGRV